MKKFLYISFFIFLSLTMNSCRSVFRASEMFYLKDKEEISPNSELLQIEEYSLACGDEINVLVFSNNGEKLLQPLSIDGQASNNTQVTYTIESNGSVNLPKIGYIKLAGYTLHEADSVLVQEYKKSVVEPYVQINVLNKRAYIFPGGGDARAVIFPLVNEQTSLVEALAFVGGINQGKARKIKLIRRDGLQNKIYMIDLSKYDHIQYASANLQANDLIYVAPRSRISQKILEEMLPYLSLITTAALIYNITR